jgi:hypothetical protein
VLRDKVGVDKSTVYQLLVAVFGVGAIVFSFLATFEGKKEQKTKDEQAANQFKRLEGQLGNSDMTEQFLTAQRKLTQQYAGETAAKDVEEFARGKDDRKRLREGVESANQRLLNQARLRIQPVHDLLLATIDAWVQAAEAKGIKFTYTKRDKEHAVVADPDRTQGDSVREISFGKGVQIDLIVSPGLIRDGVLSEQYHATLHYMPSGGGDARECVWSVGANNYRVENLKPQRYTFETYAKTNGATNPPFDDEIFVKRTRVAITQVLAHLVGKHSD